MAQKEKQTKSPKILIAEDSRTQAAQLAFLLEEHGYQVVVSANGKEALEKAGEEKPDLIVSDIVMPEMDGYELCKAIKSDEALKDTPVTLVTTLSDLQDVVRGLECGADNFIRKPYDESYLLSRINYLLVNRQLNHTHAMRMGVEIRLAGQKFFITSERQQILDLLISTYEQAIQINNELKQREKDLAHSNQVLEGLYHLAEGLNGTSSEQQVLDLALEKLMEIPGVQAGWICMRDGDAGIRTAAKANLPSGLDVPGVLEMDCQCHREVLDDELTSTDNVLGCEVLAEVRKSGKDISDLKFHASVPLRLGEHTVGVINLAGPDKGMFDEDMLKMLNNIGYQVAVALERARLHEHMERLVRERTAALTEEIKERNRIEEEQRRLVAIIEATPDFVGTRDADGNVLYVNEGGLRMLGRKSGQGFADLSFGEGHPDWALKLVTETGIPYAMEHGVWTGETAFLRPDGTELPVLQVIIAHKGEGGVVEYVSTIARDITQQKEQQQRIDRLNRLYALLSGINTTIVRVHDRDTLFQEACTIAVEVGKLRMAWIGLLDADGDKIVPASWAGTEEGFLQSLDLNVHHGPCGLAMRKKSFCISNDVAIDPRMSHWREEALLRGFQSAVALPLFMGNKVMGVFNLYANEKNFFDTGEIKLLNEIAGDISFALDHIENEQRANYLANYDELTDLSNTTLFLDRLSQSLHMAEEMDSMVAVAVIDLDNFRSINETFGRATADDLLKQTAGRLATAALERQQLARIGADAFAILLDSVDSASDVATLLEQQVFSQFNAPFMLGDQELALSFKTGIALYPSDGKEAHALFRNAEAALQNARSSGDRYLFYTPEINASVAENLTLESKLRRALDQEQFVLYYQPKVDLKSNQIVGLEALIRWNDPDSGLVMPAKFIPLLEETGMILDVGRWALEQAISDSRRWMESGLQPPRTAVNVSQVQIRQKDVVKVIKRALSGWEDAAKYLDLEITESLLMYDLESNILKMKQIQEMGVEFAIDDFGTGYSSLSYIARLPANALKIDRSFIINMAESPDDLSIVSTIISLAHSLNMTVVAEGVETKEQADLLRLLKCDSIQGYLFSPAVPAEQIESFLSKGKSLA